MIRTYLRKILPDGKMVLPAEFILKMAVVYVFWRIIKFSGEHYENFLFGGWDWFKDEFGKLLAMITGETLRLLGYNLVYQHRMIVVDGTPGLYVGDLCLGIAPLFIFTGFILSFGDNARDKFWFIPLGLVLILAVNVLRLMALVFVQMHYRAFFKLAHEYVYVILTYGLIFLLVVWWMEVLADKKSAGQVA